MESLVRSEEVDVQHALSNLSTLYMQTEVKGPDEIKLIEPTFHKIFNEIDRIIIKNTAEQKRKRSRFSVFECLTRHHLEDLHSKFLPYLLNPLESHDFGDLFLPLFIETIQENPDICSEFKNGELDLPNARLVREKFIGCSYDTDFYGFIDIFISTNKLDIVIENKIKAIE